MRIIAVLLLVVIHISLNAQPFQITFTGSGLSNTVTAVEVQNLTQGTTLTLAGTDILELVTTIGLPDPSMNVGQILIYPNPAESNCKMEFYNKQSGDVRIDLFDATGKLLLRNEDYLTQGGHSYDLAGLKSGMFVLKLNTPASTYSVKIISTGVTEGLPLLRYAGGNSQTVNNFRLTSTTGTIQMQYNAGDMLLFKGISGNYSRVITLLLTMSQAVNFEFVACTDVDGNHYPVVTIGTQTWMAENLKTTKYNNSNAIPLVTDISAWTGLTTPAYCWYNNDYSTCGSVYGALYNWFTVESGNLCPTGWHVPTDTEWTVLSDFLGGDSISGGPLKETDTTHWSSPNNGATNSSGFTALPGGYRGYFNNGFKAIGSWGNWWSSSAYSSAKAWFLSLYNYERDAYKDFVNKDWGYSVRCVRD